MSGVAVRLVPVDELGALEKEWRELAEAGGNVFASWEWVDTWWRHRGEGKRLLIFSCRDDGGRLVAVLPLYLWLERPARVARFLGHGPADELGPVVAPGDEAPAAAGLVQAVEEASLDILLAELLPGGRGWRAALGGTTLLRESSPSASLEGGWEAYLGGRSANLRQQVRRKERNLARRYVLRYRLADDPRRLQDDLTLLFSLHGTRWGRSASAFAPWEAFHREFAAVAQERGWLRLWFLELDGRPAAAWYGFRFGGVEAYYQAGRDAAHDDGSVGFVLLAHTIRDAAEDGVREYRFLRGAEPYKLRFADRDDGLETVALARGARGRIARAAAAGLRGGRVRSALRRLAGER
jgi:CelD/BcsL family acetyltransferase involved in cellulose biosynthesis